MLGLGFGISHGGDGGLYNPINALGSDLLAYWEADRSDTITASGGLVSAWRDVIGGLNVGQSGGANKPVYDPSIFNGKPAITFDGIDDALEGTIAANALPTGANPCEMWVLVDQQEPGVDGDAVNRTAFMYGTGNFIFDRRVRKRNISGVQRSHFIVGDGVSSNQVEQSDIVVFGRHVMRNRVISGQIAHGIDLNTPLTGSATAGTTVSKVAIGSIGVAGGQIWKGSIAACLVTKQLTVQKAADLNIYLNSRR